MQMGTVVGSATSTVKHRTLVGWRLLIVQLTAPDGRPDGEPILAGDQMGAGAGDEVIVTTDAVLVRELVGAKDSPLRYTVLGIADG